MRPKGNGKSFSAVSCDNVPRDSAPKAAE